MLFGKRMLQLVMVCAAIPGVALAQSAKGEPKTGGVEIGAPAPNFTLTGTDGKTYTLADLKDKTVVLQWENEACPISKKVMPATKATAEKYIKNGIVFFAIDSTHSSSIDANKKWVANEKLPFVILGDYDGTVGKLYGAKVTPEVFIIHKGTLVYHGALTSKDGDRNFAAEALDAIAEGKPVAMAKTEAYGCTVKYKK